MGNIKLTSALFKPAFQGDGYAMSYVVQTVLHSRILKITRDDGLIGYGELISDPGYDLATIFAMEDMLFQQLSDINFENILIIARRLRQKDKRYKGFSFALETAYFDLLAKAAQIPMYSIFGGEADRKIPDYLSLSCDTPEKMAAEMKQKSEGRIVIQAKLDGKGIELNVSRIDAILPYLTDKQTLLLDFNGACSVTDALTIASHFDDERIHWEEPCLTYEENRQFAEKSGQFTCFDQCLGSINAVLRACRDKVATSAVVKPSHLGSITDVITIRDILVANGIQMRIDGVWSAPVASAAVLHIANSVPSEYLMTSIDLSYPLVLEHNWEGYCKDTGMITMNNKNGLGVNIPAILDFN